MMGHHKCEKMYIIIPFSSTGGANLCSKCTPLYSNFTGTYYGKQKPNVIKVTSFKSVFIHLQLNQKWKLFGEYIHMYITGIFLSQQAKGEERMALPNILSIFQH